MCADDNAMEARMTMGAKKSMRYSGIKEGDVEYRTARAVIHIKGIDMTAVFFRKFFTVKIVEITIKTANPLK